MALIDQVRSAVDEYCQWLGNGISLKSVSSGEWIEITAPMLDRHNDHIQIYVKRSGQGWILTDAAFTLEDLEMSGCDIASDRMKLLLSQMLPGFGVSLDSENAISAWAADKDFSRQMNSLLQEILAVNGLFYLAKPSID